MAKLTAKQEFFCKEYLIDLNATQAAMRAGYSEKTANEQGSRLLANVKVQRRIKELKDARSERTQIDADWLLRQLGEEALADVADLYDEATGALKPVHKWPKIWRQGLVAGIDVNQLTLDGQTIGETVKVKLADRTRIKELIGKHVDVGAFRDRVSHEGSLTEDVAALMMQISHGATK